mgnify:CR=1 FL=1
MLLKSLLLCSCELFSNYGYSGVSCYSVASDYSVNNFFNNFYYRVSSFGSFSVFSLVAARNHRKTCENSERQE